MIDRSFWRTGESSFSTELRMRVAPEVSRLSSRPGETGSGLLAQLQPEGCDSYRLHKTNDWAPHPVLGAVYGDLIFHFGAGSRHVAFAADDAHYSLDQSAPRERYRRQLNRAVQQYLLTELREAPAALYRSLSPSLAPENAPVALVRRVGPSGAIVLTCRGVEERASGQGRSEP